MTRIIRVFPRQMMSIGFTSMAMLWRPETPLQERRAPERPPGRVSSGWARPAIIHSEAAE